MILFLALFFVLILTFIVPQFHKILRDKKNYNYLLIFSWSVLVIAIVIILFNNLTQLEKRNLLSPICPITFLYLYKLCDQYCLKKYNRNIYFTIKSNSFWKDEESDEATFIEFIFQTFLLVIPIGSWLVVSELILKFI